MTLKVFTRNTEGDHFVCCSADWKCGRPFWKCPDEKCFPKDFVCNGFSDCGDGSDERNCGKFVFGSGVVVVIVAA